LSRFGRVLALIGLSGAAASAIAIDHNNIDGGRPLRFDDAYSIAYRERAIEVGLERSFRSSRAGAWEAKLEFKYGFGKNRDVSIGVEPSLDSGYFEHVRRETDKGPALAYRVDTSVPTEDDGSGVGGRLRGILTCSVGQFDKLHVNLDVNAQSRRRAGERSVTLGLVLGYSKPLGFPKRFDSTFVADFALEQEARTGGSWRGSVGVGLRRQLDVRSVLDLGIEAEVFAGPGASRVPARLTLGYSVSF
jgi:hypothetical protein